MSILPSPQVCVIDDDPKDYRKLLAVLGELHLGVLHIKGDRREELPQQPLRNLRLVFLDMNLGTLANAGNRVVATHTANVFCSVVSADSAPLAVVVWTKWEDLIEDFRKALYEAKPGFRGRLFFLRLEDKKRLRGMRKALTDAVTRGLSTLEPLPLLWGWSVLVQDAAASVAAELCRLAAGRAGLQGTEDEAQERERTCTALREILGSLVRAEAGKATSPAAAPGALLSALAPLHFDRMENMSAVPELDAASALVPADVPAPDLGPDERLSINSMLLLGQASTAGPPFRPGTIYQISDPKAMEEQMGLSPEAMAREIYCQTALVNDEHRLQEWLAATRPVLVEVSPACDYSQQKRPMARLIGGFLVPEGEAGQVKKDGGASRRLEPTRLPNSDDRTAWVLCLSSQAVITWRQGRTAGFLEPMARLREAVLADLRHWVAAQSARPGYLYAPSPRK